MFMRVAISFTNELFCGSIISGKVPMLTRRVWLGAAGAFWQAESTIAKTTTRATTVNQRLDFIKISSVSSSEYSPYKLPKNDLFIPPFEHLVNCLKCR
jgi:hypothetical protein